jgi:hypothetical protein
MNIQVPDLHPEHARHDPMLVAADAAGDQGDDWHHARLQACADCGRLADDLRAIASAIASLPAARRERDFTLTPARAAHLQSRWRRLLSTFRPGRSPVVPRLAASLTSLGVAGLLLASLPGISPSAGVPFDGAPRSVTEQSFPSPATDTAGGKTGGEAPHPPGPQGGVNEPAAGGGSAHPGDMTLQRSEPTTLLVLSGSFFIVGLGLFAARWSAGRFS